jgi:carbonyl reductase 1
MLKVAVVTGSNKGIGYEIVRGLLQKKFDGDVFLTSRSEERGLEAVEKLNKVRIRN